MIRRLGVLLFSTLLPIVGAAEAQESDAQVLRAGEVRIAVTGEYLHFSELLESGGRRSLGAELGGRIDPAGFAPLAPLASHLEGFFARTPGGAHAIGEDDLLAGDLSTTLGWNTRIVPVRLGIGLLPRLEIGARLAAYRDERFPRFLALEGGSLGLNPDPQFNRGLFERVDDASADLGAFPTLPLESSPLGVELQRRVQAATGERLRLPSDPLNAATFRTAFGIDPFPHRIDVWRAGDLELDGRLRLLSTFGDRYYPEPGRGVDLRVAVEGAARVPLLTGVSEDSRVHWGPEVGHGGFRAGAAGDLFVGDSFWLSSGGSFSRLRPAEIRMTPYTSGPIQVPAEPLTLTRDPGWRSDLWLIPRVRLTGDLAVGGSLRILRWGEGRIGLDAEETETPARSATSLGFTFRYSSLSGYDAGTARLPIEASVGFSGSVAGTGGAAAGRTAFVQISLLGRLWGRRVPRS